MLAFFSHYHRLGLHMPEKWVTNNDNEKTKLRNKTDTAGKCLHPPLASPPGVHSKEKGTWKILVKWMKFGFVFLIQAPWDEWGWITMWHLSCLASTTSTARFFTRRAHNELHLFKCQVFPSLMFEAGSLHPLLWHRTGLRNCKPSAKVSFLSKAATVCSPSFGTELQRFPASPLSGLPVLVILKVQNRTGQIPWKG